MRLGKGMFRLHIVRIMHDLLCHGALIDICRLYHPIAHPMVQKPYRHRSAFPRHTFHATIPLHQVTELFHDGHPQACPLFSIDGIGDIIVKNMCLLFRRHATSRILHPAGETNHIIIQQFCRDQHTNGTGTGIFHRICQEILHHFPDPVLIAQDGLGNRRKERGTACNLTSMEIIQ